MSVDPTHMSQPAAAQPSSPQNPVAPVQGQQGPATSPGVGQPGQGQPVQSQQQPVAGPPQGVTPPAAPVGVSQVDPQRLREQQELAQYRQVVGAMQQHLQEQQGEQEFDNRLTMLLAQAENMPTAEANTFLRNQFKALRGQDKIAFQQQMQAVQGQTYEQLKMAYAPQYAEHLAQTNGLSAEARDELISLGDPDLMYRALPGIKQRYDWFNSQLQQFQQGQVQQARSQEVLAMTQAGLGAFGGQTGGTFQIELDDNMDPDERAMAIYNASVGQPGNYRVRQ